ncbi:MAG: hypothetical protein AAFU79_18995 [Myxococcota bacterium]
MSNKLLTLTRAAQIATYGLAAFLSAGCEDDLLLRDASEAAEPEAPSDSSPPPRIPIDVPVSERCELDALTETFEVYFPARAGCAFSTDRNLPPRNEHIQARAVDVASIELPSVSALCDLALRSRQGPPIAFDDDVAILLETVVLVAGGSGLALDEYPKLGGFPRFGWEDVRGQPFRPRNSPYVCLGGGRCVVPSTEQLGQLAVSIESETLISLAESFDLERGINVSFVTFGDNDPSDCAHGDLRMDLEVRYLP